MVDVAAILGKPWWTFLLLLIISSVGSFLPHMLLRQYKLNAIRDGNWERVRFLNWAGYSVMGAATGLVAAAVLHNCIFRAKAAAYSAPKRPPRKPKWELETGNSLI